MRFKYSVSLFVLVFDVFTASAAPQAWMLHLFSKKVRNHSTTVN